MMAKRGRPTKFTEAIATEICDRLASGESLRQICKAERMPSESCVRTWALDDREGFYTQYARARDIALDKMADEIIDIADGEGDAQTKRIRFDARRWYLSKLAPKRYGDRQQIEHLVPTQKYDVDDLTDEELMAIIMAGRDS